MKGSVAIFVINQINNTLWDYEKENKKKLNYQISRHFNSS